MGKKIRTAAAALAGLLIMCTMAFASVTGCVVTSATNINYSSHPDYLALMACEEITLEDVLTVNIPGGMILAGNKTLVFSQMPGKRGQIRANGFTPAGDIKIKLAPMENAALTGGWPSKDSLKESPVELITITNTQGYMPAEMMDLFKQYEVSSAWTNFWKAGYKIGSKTDPDNGKVKAVTLTWDTPHVDPVSPDVSPDINPDDGGGGCNMGMGLLGILGIGLLVLKGNFCKDDF